MELPICHGQSHSMRMLTEVMGPVPAPHTHSCLFMSLGIRIPSLGPRPDHRTVQLVADQRSVPLSQTTLQPTHMLPLTPHVPRRLPAEVVW